MRKIVFGLLLVACVTSVASAQLNLFYDVRDNTADILSPAPPYTASASLATYFPYGIGQEYPLFNGGGKGDGQRIFLSPQIEDVTDYTGFGAPDGIPESVYSSYIYMPDPANPKYDWSLGDFYLYAEFAGAAKVVSSIGATQDIPAAAFAVGGGMYLASATAAVENASLWDGTNFTGSGTSIKIKAVKVPVAGSPPAFDALAGLHNGSFEKIAKVHVQSSVRNGESAVGNWGVKLSVNELLCTQVQYPGSAGALALNLGYAAGAPEAASGSGSVLGATSATDDMVITVVRKGDFDVDGVAATGSDDFAYYDIALYYDGTNCNRFETYLADFDMDGIPATGSDDAEYYKHAAVP
jgi:hypothetical protein